MINLRNIKENYENNKSNLIEVFVEVFGENNRLEITNMINNTYINFTSLPNEDYFYVMHNKSLFSEEDVKYVESRFNEYSEIKSKSQGIYINLINDYIKNNFSFVKDIELKGEFSKYRFLFSFYDSMFDIGYIDFYSSKYMNLLNDEFVSIEVKNFIIEKQELFRSEMLDLGITFGTINSEVVDNYLIYRNNLKNEYKKYILKNTNFGKNISEELDKYYDEKTLVFGTMDEICFYPNPLSSVSIPLNENDKKFYYIKIPIVELINIGAKSIDVSLIHELVHRLGRKDLFSGIEVYDKENDYVRNKYFDEVLTQKIAIKITKKAREKGIYIYNNLENDLIEGESCYEELFPLIGDFIDEHEELFFKLAFNNNGYELDNYFGNYWNILSTYIDNYYQELEITVNNGKQFVTTLDMHITTGELINEINDFYYSEERHI